MLVGKKAKHKKVLIMEVHFLARMLFKCMGRKAVIYWGQRKLRKKNGKR